MNDVKSLSHSKWRCKYHIVFASKYRRQIIYRKLRSDIGKILRELCIRKHVEILEAECCPDHIHMLVTIPPHLSVSSFMGYAPVIDINRFKADEFIARGGRIPAPLRSLTN